ncbi:MAG: DUF6851 domain-containing protein [Reichenbachiella sp.]|uniref:DUF6851 domain-containing protein n=1 Tax=Reichenbachiella sp. TaxID=2184521 RepID=UPI003263AA6E
MLKSFCSALLLLLLLQAGQVQAQSVAREWNEILLEAIRNDLARPTVHARNLFHISAAMYDAWAAYDQTASTYFLAHNHRGYFFEYKGTAVPGNSSVTESREAAISYAAFRLIQHRFQHSPGFATVENLSLTLMNRLGLNSDYQQTENYQNNPADLGNYIAQQVILFGLTDGSNEENDYANRIYQSINEPMFPESYGTAELSNPNRWQPLGFDQFIGQSGIDEGSTTPEFVGPEWGQVVPFALDENDITIKERDGHTYLVSHDPGKPPYLDAINNLERLDYQWGFSLVAQWSSHLDPRDSVRWDISPASIGNITLEDLPVNVAGLQDFYDFENGGDISLGYDLNPITGLPYTPQNVLRADYARVLAEFWADGPDSETPPGHWFVLLNYVNDHPAFERKYNDTEVPMDALEWNVKSYFALGGAMHDAAITAWGIKGFYDYIRPISAIRYMSELGQCTDPELPSYHQMGLPLIPNQIELITADDPLNEYGDVENLIKIRAWKVPGRYYQGGDDELSVDWIAGGRWQPYQRPTFVTPPFAGYVSGHSTFSRAAAEIMSAITGSEYFPGGIGEFKALKDRFLIFEKGPSEHITLQWAKYFDASDQCSLSRIWGGIHPPVDDIPGRLIGHKIGTKAFAHAERYFRGEIKDEDVPLEVARTTIGPNPIGAQSGDEINLYIKKPDDLHKKISLYNASGHLVLEENVGYIQHFILKSEGLRNGIYYLVVDTNDYTEKHKISIQR